MPEPQLHHVSCPDAGAGHRMAYWQWGATQATHTVVCVHGLSRQGRDFDVLAQAMVREGLRRDGLVKGCDGQELADGKTCWRCRAKQARKGPKANDERVESKIDNSPEAWKPGCDGGY